MIFFILGDLQHPTMKPGQEARLDYEYIRHGMVNIFMANEPLKGKRLVEITDFKTKKDWAKFIKRIADEMYPKAKKIKLVMDNFKTLDPSAFYEVFLPPQSPFLLHILFQLLSICVSVLLPFLDGIHFPSENPQEQML